MTSQSSITSASGTLSVDSLLYGYVKEKNPCLLTQLFPKEKCQELEKLDYLYDSKTLQSMLQKYRKIHRKPVNQNDRQEAPHTSNEGSSVQRQVKPIAVKEDLYSDDMMHRRFCRIDDPQTSVDLTVYNHFHLNGDLKALGVLFDEETREKFSKMVTEIDVPAVLRLVAHRRKIYERSKPENKAFPPLSTCQLCKKSIKGTRAHLMAHIGVHEDIPMYCFIEGCDKYVRSHSTICNHLKLKHP